ncbi:MAG: SusC/RagA family TonB-linked outer membrane protein [Cyclobacteriaceae bacterium]
MLNNLTTNGWVISVYLWFMMLPAIGQELASLPTDYSSTNLQYQDEQTTTLESLLISYEKKYRVSIIFNSDEIGKQKVSKLTDESTLDSSLKSLLDPIGLTFKKIDDNVYVVKRAKKRQKSVKKVERSRTVLSTNSPPTRVKRLSPKAQSYEVKFAQTISGKVTDTDTNEPLPGVNILAKGTTAGTVSDVDGNYRLTVADEVTTLVFSSIGYETVEEAISGRSTINLALAPDIQSLEEVVVVGYGSVKRRDLTGSVASISSEEIQAVPVASPEQAIQGRVPGVQVSQASAAPGGGVSIRIRGSNSVNAGNEPLYVIDGFPVYSDNTLSNVQGRATRATPNALASINPYDIESIEVLKDASATAIYGARGANGVVLITTKRGKAGRNVVNLNSYVGVQEVRNQYDLLNGSQFAEFANEAVNNIPEPLPPLYDVPAPVNTNWQDEVFRTGVVQNHSLSFSGGDGNTNYLVSGEYYNEEGVVRGSQFERYSFRFNLDKKVSERVSFGNSLTLSRSDNDIRDILATTLQALPNIPVFDNEGNYFLNTDPALVIGIGSRIDNPLAVANEVTNELLTTRALGNIYGEVKLLKGLTAKVLVGGDLIYNKENGYTPQSTLGGIDLGGAASQGTVENISWLNENTLNYQNSWNEKHSINVVVGLTFQRQNLEAYNLRRTQFPTDATSYYDISAGAEDQNISSRAFQFTLNSYLGRINYTLLDRYLFTFTARADGSSKFGEGRKYGFFPSGAVAWRISDEPFFQNQELISNLKLRTSYGITGNQEIPPYRSLNRLRAGRVIIGQEAVTSYNPANELPNPDLGWEQTTQFDIGLDIGLFNNRLNLTADYYHKLTDDLLFRVPVPANTGFSFIWENIGQIENEGFELALSSNNLVGDFRWTTSANISVNDNRVIELAQDDTQLFATLFPNTPGNVGNIVLVEEGAPIGSFYTHVFDGIWQNQDEIDAVGTMPNALPGDERYRDINEDGVINGDDRMITGNGLPRILYGFTNDFAYKNFELSLFFQGVAQADILNVTRRELELLDGDANVSTAALDRWTGSGTSNLVPRATSGGSPGPLLSDKYIEDGSFLRLRTLTLAYSLPIADLGWSWISQARFYFTGQNLLTFTDYQGIDPEVNAGGQDQLLQGFDQWSYPMQKRYIFGVNFTF